MCMYYVVTDEGTSGLFSAVRLQSPQHWETFWFESLAVTELGPAAGSMPQLACLLQHAKAQHGSERC